ncbi:uncharacterized protein LOC100179379 [Ciona intestinalis]
MESIKKKINNLKNELDTKQDKIDELMDKLKMEEGMRRAAEDQNQDLERKLRLVEGDLDRADEKLGIAKAQLSSLEQQSDDGSRAYKSLENEFNSSVNKYEAHLDDLRDSKTMAEEMSRKYEEVARRLVLMDSELEKAEERCSVSEGKNAELIEGNKELSSLLKSYEAMESSFSSKETQADDQIRVLKRDLLISDAAREAAEKSVSRMTHQMENMEDEIAYLKSEVAKAKQMYTEAVNELNEL